MRREPATRRKLILAKGLVRLVCVVIILLTGTYSEAAVRPGAWTFSLVADGYSFDGKQHLETMPVVGARIGYTLTRMLAIEGLADYVHTWGTRGNTGDAEVTRLGGDLLLHLLPGNSQAVPYLAAGYGVLDIDQDGTKAKKLGVLDYGVGLKYFITENIAVRGDFRHLLFRTGGEYLSNYEYVTGFIWQVGGRGPRVEEAVTPPEPPPEAIPPDVTPEALAPPPLVEEPPPEQPPSAEPAPGRYKYCIDLRIEFDIDRALIRPEYHDEVGRVAAFLKANPDTTAVIEAFTDNVGMEAHNQELSQRRAGSVVTYLVEKFGIDPSRLSAKGYGANRPVADNATNEGKQKNRRLQAIIDCAILPEKIEPEEHLCFTLQIEFDAGKTEIKPQYHDELARMGDYLRRYPATTATIEGHTDNVGGYRYNMELSQKRADAVVDYMVKRFSIDRARLWAKGYGYTRRIAYNSTAEGRRKNRRINVVLDCVVKPRGEK